MSFDNTLEADALEHLKACGASLHTYVPKGSASLSRYILVDNHSAGSSDGFRAIPAYVDIFVCNDATNGVAEINTGGDKITLTPRPGKTAETYRISQIIDSDAGIWHLRCDVNG
jgi:hypothetical protein